MGRKEKKMKNTKLQAMIMAGAMAANLSMKEGRPVKLSEIE